MYYKIQFLITPIYLKYYDNVCFMTNRIQKIFGTRNINQNNLMIIAYDTSIFQCCLLAIKYI